MNKCLPLLLFAALLLQGCATAPPPPIPAIEVAKFDYGPYPDNYEQIIKDYFAKTLQDPGSAQFRFDKPYKGYLQHGPLMGGKLQGAGYFSDVWLKAKLPSGGYAPEKHLVVLIRGADVLMELAEEEIARIQRPADNP